ncbi:MAG: cation transporter [Magnetococcales bacterium]|nr:cation transporter [Magnetococcales bacterium]
MAINFLITIVEAAGGIMSGSLSLLSDALHNFSDGFAMIISAIAIRLRQRGQSDAYTFGLKRAEMMAAVFNSATLIAICFYLFKEAVDHLLHPQPVEGGMMMIVAAVGLLANGLGTWLLASGAKHNMNIRSAYLHMFGDAISSVGVLAGGLFIQQWGIYWVDPVLTILISLYILKESWGIVKEAVNILMMGSPKDISPDTVVAALRNIPGVNAIHHVHMWMLDDNNVHFEGHVEVDDMLLSRTVPLRQLIHELLEQHFGVQHVVLQFEVEGCSTTAVGCGDPVPGH